MISIASKSYTMIIVVFLFILSGCGGGGNAGSTSDGGGDTLNDVNGGLTGHLFNGASNDGELLDLSTGKYTTIPGVDWTEEEENEYHSMANYDALPTRDGMEFIETVRNCYAGSDPLAPFKDCIVIHSRDGAIISRGKMDADITPTTRLSYDRGYFAFFYNPWRDSSANDELVIFDRNYQNISRTELPGTKARSFDWVPNGQIVYIYDQTIYITPAYDTTGTPVYTFAQDQGRPDYVAVSPDGTKIAFTLVKYASTFVIHGATWVMNIDGTDLHQLAHIPGEDDPIFNYPTWSPDGKYIMNVVGQVDPFPPEPGDPVVNLGVAGGLYAIPSDSRNASLKDNGEEGVIHVRSYYYSDQLNYKFNSNGNLVWIP